MPGLRHLSGFSAALTILVCASAQGQEFGQWTWDAIVGLQGRTYKNTLDQAVLRDSRYRELGLALGLNGFIINPTVADFRVAFRGALINQTSNDVPDSDQFGWSARVNLFPRGRYKGFLFAVNDRIDYDNPDFDSVSLLGSLASSSDLWGGSFVATSGPLAGLGLGFDHRNTSFAGPVSGEQRDRQYAAWRRGGRILSTNIVLEHNALEYTGDRGNLSDDLVLTADLIGTFSSGWRLNVFGVAQDRTLTTKTNGFTSKATRGSLRSTLSKTLRTTDEIRFLWSSTVLDTSPGSGSASHSFGVNYSCAVGSSMTIVPGAAVTYQEAGDLSATSFRGNLTGNWGRTQGPYGYAVTAGVGSGRTGSVETDLETQEFSGLLALSLWHGKSGGLSKLIELEWGTNQIDGVGVDLDDLPDLGARFALLGTTDRSRARFTLGKTGMRYGMNSYIEWSRRDRTSFDNTRQVTDDGVIVNLNAFWRTLVFTATGADRRIAERDVSQIDVLQNDVEERSLTAGLTWRPWPFLTIGTNYRESYRKGLISPDVDIEKLGASISFHVGLFTVTGSYIEGTERTAAGYATSNDTIMWSISRSFFGGLPVFSRVERKGFIR